MLVAPFTGAWIEITQNPGPRPFWSGVAPFTGAWIEISLHPAHLTGHIKSHPSRVRGLKFLFYNLVLIAF